jgi:hypothetical protein
VEKSWTEISTELLEELRRWAEVQGRSEGEVLEEAVRRYLRGPRPAGDQFLALLDRMSSRFGIDDPDEAMRIAVEEQHAVRRERADR